MDRWFMVFDKIPCNNREAPLYFFKNLYAEFELGYHVNYFDISEFHGMGCGYAQDSENVKHNPLFGPPLARKPTPPIHYPPLGGIISQA